MTTKLTAKDFAQGCGMMWGWLCLKPVRFELVEK